MGKADPTLRGPLSASTPAPRPSADRVHSRPSTPRPVLGILAAGHRAGSSSASDWRQELP
jgi:hypothetical protein